MRPATLCVSEHFSWPNRECRCASCGPAIGVDRLPSGPICDVALPAVDVAAYLASHPTYRRDRAAKIEAEGLPASAEQA